MEETTWSCAANCAFVSNHAIILFPLFEYFPIFGADFNSDQQE